MRATRRSTARQTHEVTSLHTAELTRKDWVKEVTFKKLVKGVVSAERSASSGHVAKKENLVAVKVSNVTDAIVGIPYLIQDVLTANMIPSPNDGDSYGITDMAAITQAIIDKRVSAKFESVFFESRLHQTLVDIVP